MRALLTFSIFCIFQITINAQEYFLPAEQPFQELRITGNIHLYLEVSDSLFMRFEGTALPEQLDIEWSENRLTLKTPLDLKKEPAIHITLHYKKLSNLEITRGAVVQSADTLTVPGLTLRVETGGKAELTILSDSLSARVNQGADIILRGETRSQFINAYTFGNYLGYELESERCWVKAASGAQVKVKSTKYLDANATSKAFIGYLGSPEQKEFKSSVGGEITRQNP